MRPINHETSRWTARDWMMMLTITAVGGLARFLRLDEPARQVFDEAFYVPDSCLYAGLAEATCSESQLAEVHPPLAKWLISLGIRALGYDALGWRIAAAIAGTLAIAVLYVLAKKLLDSTLSASLTAGLFAFDFLHFVQSRVAMLDVFVTLFSTMAFALLAIERKQMLHRQSRARSMLLRCGIGIACGAAVASKWSGGLTLVACIWLLLAWSSTQQTGSSSFSRLAGAIKQEGASLAATLILVPGLVYAISFVGTLDTPQDAGPATWGTAFTAKQIDMLNFHRHTVDTTIASSPPWSWPLIKRPVPYFVEKNARVVEVWFGGNPLLWWAALVALVYAASRWIRNQDPRDPAGFIVAGFALLYAPWLLLTIPPFTWARDLVFIFYLLPALPFMYLALVYGIHRLHKRLARRSAATLVTAAALGGFAFFYPILSAQAVSKEAWSARVRWFDDCKRPPPGTLEFPDVNGSGIVTLTLRSDNPPSGWCWK